jgi:hypothetical protein
LRNDETIPYPATIIYYHALHMVHSLLTFLKKKKYIKKNNYKFIFLGEVGSSR